MALQRHELRERGIHELDSTCRKPDGEDVGLFLSTTPRVAISDLGGCRGKIFG